MTAPAVRWLLDILSEHCVAIGLFADPEIGLSLNVRDPPGGMEALLGVVLAAQRDGLIAFYRRDKPMAPRDLEHLTRWCKEECTTWNRRFDGPSGSPRPVHTHAGLTQRGAELWASMFEPRWDLRVDGYCGLDEPFDLPDGFEGQTLLGPDRATVEADRIRMGATLLAEAAIDDWQPAYWLPNRPGHRMSCQVPLETSRSVQPEPTWRLPRYLGITTEPPTDPRQRRGTWTSSVVPTEALVDINIWDVLVGPDRLQLRLGHRCSGILEIRGAREVLEEPRRVASTAVLHRIQATATGFVLDIVWETGHGRVIEAEQLVLPNTTALWWTCRPSACQPKPR